MKHIGLITECKTIFRADREIVHPFLYFCQLNPILKYTTICAKKMRIYLFLKPRSALSDFIDYINVLIFI